MDPVAPTSYEYNAGVLMLSAALRDPEQKESIAIHVPQSIWTHTRFRLHLWVQGRVFRDQGPKGPYNPLYM